MAACNPFQLTSLGDNSIYNVALTHPQRANFLSHRVSPIAYTMLTRLHDYGSLDADAESQYIRGIISSIFGRNEVWRRFFRNSRDGQVFIHAALQGQRYLKRINNIESSMSLRDVHRVKAIFEFYYMLLAYEKRYSRIQLDFEEYQMQFRSRNNRISRRRLKISLEVSLYLNYVIRIGVPGTLDLSANPRPQKGNHRRLPRDLESLLWRHDRAVPEFRRNRVQ